MILPFNGGKMNHIFTPGKGIYEEGFASAAAESCFHNPNTVVTLKVHGECCLLIKTAVDDGFAWTFTTRYDTRGQKDPPPGAIPVPQQASPQPAVFEKHHYWFVPLPRDSVVGRGQRKSAVGPDTYSAIQQGVLSGMLPDPNAVDCPDYVSVEWIGRKHQGNVDMIDADHALTVHGSVVLNHLLPVPRSREQVEALAETLSIEGFVLYDPDSGERFKIRLDMLPNSLFKTRTALPVTKETTTIKPLVILAEEDGGRNDM